MSTAYVGFSSAPRDDWETYYVEPDAPASYKKDEAIKDYKDKAKLKFQQAAATNPITGQLKDVMFQLNGKTMKLEPNDDPLEILTNSNCKVVVGIEIFTFLELAVSSSIERKPFLNPLFRWAKISRMMRKSYLPLPSQSPEKFVMDPISVLNCADYEAGELPLICSRFNISMPTIGGAPGALALSIAAAKRLGF